MAAAKTQMASRAMQILLFLLSCDGMGGFNVLIRRTALALKYTHLAIAEDRIPGFTIHLPDNW